MKLFTRLLLPVCLFFSALPAQAIEVVATTRPLALIAKAVAGEQAQVRPLFPDSASAHHPTLRPSDRKALLSANIVLRAGTAYDAFLERLLTTRKGDVLTAQNLPGIHLQTARQRDGLPQTGKTIDPHLWLDPQNAVVIADALAALLAKKDVANANHYRQQAQQFSERISVLQKTLHEGKTQSLPYIAWHDAYQYLEPTLHLQFRGSLTLDEDTPPSARHFQWMAQRIQQEKIGCFLAEPNFDPRLIRRLDTQKTLNIVAVDEMFTSSPITVSGYEEGLRAIANSIDKCR